MGDGVGLELKGSWDSSSPAGGQDGEGGRMDWLQR